VSGPWDRPSSRPDDREQSWPAEDVRPPTSPDAPAEPWSADDPWQERRTDAAPGWDDWPSPDDTFVPDMQTSDPWAESWAVDESGAAEPGREPVWRPDLEPPPADAIASTDEATTEPVGADDPAAIAPPAETLPSSEATEPPSATDLPRDDDVPAAEGGGPRDEPELADATDEVAAFAPAASPMDAPRIEPWSPEADPWGVAATDPWSVPPESLAPPPDRYAAGAEDDELEAEGQGEAEAALDGEVESASLPEPEPEPEPELDALGTSEPEPTPDEPAGFVKPAPEPQGSLDPSSEAWRAPEPVEEPSPADAWLEPDVSPASAADAAYSADASTAGAVAPWDRFEPPEPDEDAADTWQPPYATTDEPSWTDADGLAAGEPGSADSLLAASGDPLAPFRAAPAPAALSDAADDGTAEGVADAAELELESAPAGDGRPPWADALWGNVEAEPEVMAPTPPPISTRFDDDDLPPLPRDATQVFPTEWVPPVPRRSGELEPSEATIRTTLAERSVAAELGERPSTAEQAVPWLIGLILLLAGMVIVLLALIFAGDASLGGAASSPSASAAGLLPSASGGPRATPSARATAATSPSAAASPSVLPVPEYGPLEMVYQGRAAALAPIYLLRHDFTTSDDPVVLAQDPNLDVRRLAWAPDGTVGAGLLSDILVSIEPGKEKRRLGEGISTITFGDDAQIVYAVRVTRDGGDDVATVLAINFANGNTSEVASVTYAHPGIGEEAALKEAQFTDDGGTVRLFWMDDGTLTLWSLGGGVWNVNPRSGDVTDIPDALPELLAPDGRHWIQLSEKTDGTVIVYRNGADAELAATTVPGLVSHLRWSPDGERIVFTVGRSAQGGGVLQDLFLWDLEDGAAPMQLTSTGAAFGAEWLGTTPHWDPAG
jgi:hypothetical protein